MAGSVSSEEGHWAAAIAASGGSSGIGGTLQTSAVATDWRPSIARLSRATVVTWRHICSTPRPPAQCSRSGIRLTVNFQVGEAGGAGEEAQRHDADRAVAMLGDMDLGDALLSVSG